MRLVLDAEMVSALPGRRHPAERKVRRAMEAARRLRREVTIATGTLAELYRGAGRAIRRWTRCWPEKRAVGSCSAIPIAARLA